MKEEKQNSVFLARVWLSKGGTNDWPYIFFGHFINRYKLHIFSYPDELWFSMVSLSALP
jgi:hypothetical protein